MRNLIKDKNGFTLLETILSVVMLSIISVFILNMFVAADRVNKKAVDTDRANMAAVSVIEMFKSSGGPEQFAADGYFDGCMINLDKNDISILVCFDDEWNRISSEQEQAAYNMDIKVGAVEDAAGMHSINVTVTKNRDIHGAEILSFYVTKYFSG